MRNGSPASSYLRLSGWLTESRARPTILDYDRRAFGSALSVTCAYRHRRLQPDTLEATYWTRVRMVVAGRDLTRLRVAEGGCARSEKDLDHCWGERG
jgi:hypothetical protein